MSKNFKNLQPYMFIWSYTVIWKCRLVYKTSLAKLLTEPKQILQTNLSKKAKGARQGLSSIWDSHFNWFHSNWVDLRVQIVSLIISYYYLFSSLHITNFLLLIKANSLTCGIVDLRSSGDFHRKIEYVYAFKTFCWL